MGIQPIDLSTIYSQLDKLSQMNASQIKAADNSRDATLQKAVQNDLEKSKKVEEAAKKQPGSEKIKNDRNGGGSDTYSDGGRRRKPSEEPEDVPEQIEITDPRLGRIIDITG